jgi:hypothetical protein
MMNVTVKTSVKQKGVQLLAPMALAAAMFLPWTNAQALPFTSDIAITGAADFVDVWAQAIDVDQTGSYSVTQSGATITNTITGVAVTGGDPLAATLTQTGDGFGITANAASTTLGADGEFPVGVDFVIANNSISSIYKITLQFDYDHSVDADGDDAFAISEYSLFDNTLAMDLFFRRVISDTVFGDEKNGANLATAGDLVADSGIVFLDLIINPGELFDLTLRYDLSTGIPSGSTGLIDASFSSFLSIAGVERVENGAVVSAPATLPLLLAGVLGLMASRRRHHFHSPC